MATINDITGDSLVSKSNTQKFRDNYDKVFLTVEPYPEEKEKIAKRKEYLLGEVKNYTAALGSSKFNNYYLQRIEQLEIEIAELEG